MSESANPPWAYRHGPGSLGMDLGLFHFTPFPAIFFFKFRLELLPTRATSEGHSVNKTDSRAKSRSARFVWATGKKLTGICALPPRAQRVAWKPASGANLF